ncbi:hypothetical protein PUW24_20160 [Paenibacillus urinalis]|uniref:Signal transduction histidine kinase 5TM receptor LytS transmembrane region domain-containing protein n=1 Tax=Paenibacillus urinalis TaxID=521520 RepID=A0AAX3MS40_9BACL|nr:MULTISPECIES: hypothetical protein [Paenibacillus]WDH80421.1 hypothetical protein PUW23_12660 [Paenibacillus urinalis]WDH96461.1 hypothetical protein PUW24_20160 [Paenibacillus urinalis]WDI04685.1 hypothetical protein PUW25_12325 [Paenibacillus urinalis]GAK40600.1 hypothetical protein TCA2_3090 [Paenibacillus sp. TCA20]
MDVILFIMINVLLISSLVVSYVHLNKRRRQINHQLGMNISMTISMICALSFGALWGFQFPMHSSWVTIAATVLSMLTGFIYGRLVDMQCVITGISSGMMTGLMGPMIVMHTNRPALLLIFIMFLFFFSMILLCGSVHMNQKDER